MATGVYLGVYPKDKTHEEQMNEIKQNLFVLEEEIYFYNDTIESGNENYLLFLENINNKCFSEIVIYDLKSLSLTLFELVSFFEKLINLKIQVKCFYPNLEVNRMKGKRAFIVIVLGFFLIINACPSYAQKAVRTLTLLYSNNINGELEPCPT